MSNRSIYKIIIKFEVIFKIYAKHHTLYYIKLSQTALNIAAIVLLPMIPSAKPQ